MIMSKIILKKRLLITWFKTQQQKYLKVGLTNTIVVVSKFFYFFRMLKPYFNIDTEDFFKRFFHSLIPFNPYFYDSIENNPDLWGPFWIYTFLIFAIAACGSLQTYLSNTSLPSSFYQTFLPVAAGMIYGVGFILPSIIYILMKCFGSDSVFMNILCTYGYSMGIYIPAIVACTFPIGVSLKLFLVYSVDCSRLCNFRIFRFIISFLLEGINKIY